MEFASLVCAKQCRSCAACFYAQSNQDLHYLSLCLIFLNHLQKLNLCFKFTYIIIGEGIWVHFHVCFYDFPFHPWQPTCISSISDFVFFVVVFFQNCTIWHSPTFSYTLYISKSLKSHLEHQIFSYKWTILLHRNHLSTVCQLCKHFDQTGFPFHCNAFSQTFQEVSPTK